jgi:tetratricopeptide (TPR) repeat protein
LRAQTPDAKTKTELELGVAAYDNGLYPEAIQHLGHAVSRDPTGIVGHFYLASAYDCMCGSPNGCEASLWEGAIREYKRVLELDPSHKEAVRNLAYVFYRLARVDEAADLYRRAARLDENDPWALYSIAVLDWRRTYPILVLERVRLNLPQKASLIDSPSCYEMRAKTLADVEEGIAVLNRSVQLLNTVAMQTYMGLLYKERAELQCGDRVAYQRDLKTEQQWWNRVNATFRNKKQHTDEPMWIPPPPPPPPRRRGLSSWPR